MGGGTSTVTRSPSKSTYYEGESVTLDGESVTLTANPAAGYAFSYWSGDHIGTSNPATVVMDSNKTVYAHFTELDHVYALDRDRRQRHRHPQSRQAHILRGRIGTLTAHRAPAGIFVRWWGSIASTNNPVTFTMNNNKAVKVTFEHD